MGKISLNIYETYGKRLFDMVVSGCALLMFSPLLCITAVLVRYNLGSPILFSQNRPGLNGELFTLYKFRSMRSDVDRNGKPLPDAQRLTKFGKLLRATSLDELPELWNILKGDMSFVGPRPLLVEYLPLYDKTQSRRHSVRPGLSGLAQVNGRNTLSWEDRFELDVQYVDSISFRQDIQLLVKTVWKVVEREGISSATSITMEPFKGTSSNETGRGYGEQE